MSLIIFGKWRTLTLFNGIHISQPKPEMLQKDYQVLRVKEEGTRKSWWWWCLRYEANSEVIIDHNDILEIRSLESQKTSAIRRQTEKLKLSNTDRKER